MNNAQTIPNDSVGGVITFDILSEGTQIDPAIQVLSIQVNKTVNRVPFAKIFIRDGETETATFKVSDGATFVPGKEVEIKIGFDSNNETIFIGKIVKQKIKIRQSGESILCVECRDAAYATTLGAKNRYFTEVTDSAALEEILNEYGLLDTVEVTSVNHRELVQYHSTDWDFLQLRAEANGLLVLAKDGKVSIKPPSTSGSPALQLAFGGNLLSFEAEMDARHQWKSVKTQAWDHANQALFESESSSSDFGENGNIKGSDLAENSGLASYDLRHAGFMDTAELQNWADAAILKSRLSKIRGRARFIGTFVIQQGDVVELQGVGERFNGNVFVTGVNYEVVDGSCFVDIQFGLSPNWYYQEYPVSAPLAGGINPGVHGLQVGTVKQIEGDPDGADRILVTLPIIDPNGDGVWARLATLDAGENRGWVVRPEIGDEVIVGFISGDPRDAVVLGQLHSSSKPAPIATSDDNHEKGYTSRSEMHLSFDDDQKIITIDTPAGNKLVISEADTAITLEDQNGNSIILNADGIAISSAADIKMEAAGKIEIAATQDLKGEGMNVNFAGQTAFKAEGSATAELSSGGQTTVKGSMLMLN